MSALNQTIGHGSQLQLGSGGGGETFTSINGVMSIDFGSNKVETPENTDMGTTGTKRTFIGGLEDPGDVSVKLNVIPGDSTQASLHAAKDSAQHDFKVIAPGAVFTRAFSGIISSFDLSIPDDKIPTITVKIKVSGPITETTF